MRKCPFIAGVIFVVLYSWEGPLAQVREGNRSSGFTHDAPSAIQTCRDKLHAIVTLDYVESEHPRDEQGQWTEKDGGQEANPHIASLVTAAKAVSERMGFDASRIDVVQVPPFAMKVGGRVVVRSAFYDPRNGRIEINASHTTGSMAGMQGLIAHEVTHAQQDVLDKVMAQEHDAIRELSAEERHRLFLPNGFPRKATIPEIEKRWPASAAMAKAAPGGDSWLGTWTKGRDGQWVFDPEAYAEEGGRLERMIHEDGFTEYSKLYWVEYHNATDEIRKVIWKRRAIQETLAEVAMYHELRDEWDEGVPSPSWLRFWDEVRQVYPTIKSKASQ